MFALVDSGGVPVNSANLSHLTKPFVRVVETDSNPEERCSESKENFSFVMLFEDGGNGGKINPCIFVAG
jgi:hypothetical protein